MDKNIYRPNFPLVNEISETPVNLDLEISMEDIYLVTAVEERARLFPLMRDIRFSFARLDQNDEF